MIYKNLCFSLLWSLKKMLFYRDKCREFESHRPLHLFNIYSALILLSGLPKVSN